MNIRNFCIIAHIDHGKSTLADRFLEITNTVEKRKMKAQLLDQMELERERGITIKMAPVRMVYHSHRGTSQTETRKDAETELLYKDITYKIRGAAFTVRKNIGLGHKEIVYQKALAEELKKNNLRFEQEKVIEIFYDGKKIGTYQPDFIVENKIILELKALPAIGKPQEEQLWSYIKGSSYKLGLLINFGSTDIEIKRVIYDTARFPRESASSPRESAQVEYILNLIDTPGHSDFAYEVSRALHAVEGAILLVDATQGVQAQTLANLRAAEAANLKIIGALNKVDMNPVGLDDLTLELAELIGAEPDEIHRISGKTGEGVERLLQAVIEKIPPPKSQINADQDADKRGYNISVNLRNNPRESAVPARALVFDSFYDNHKGIVASVRVVDGTFEGDKETIFVATGRKWKPKEIGIFAPELTKKDALEEGEIGYIATGVKDVEGIKIGDTVVQGVREGNASLLLTGYKEPNPVVFISFYPEDADEHEELGRALQKLRLSDSSISIEPDSNEILGRGFKVGFLGSLHFEIITERLKREFDIGVSTTFPSVAYRVKIKGEWKVITDPMDLSSDVEAVEEPMVQVEILLPQAYVSNFFGVQQIFRFGSMETETKGTKTQIRAFMPLSELMSDFDDKLKSATQGYASFSYEVAGYEPADMVRVDFLVAGEAIPGMSRLLPKSTFEKEARKTVERLKELLPRQQFVQAIQAAAHGRVIARENIPALKKNVTGHLYGGDRTRKMKLWKKQKKGKAKLKERAHVEITPEVFRELLKK
ncbi:MAG: GxxExxY protein [Nanoarchaeota archaeon]|nr:GxxExxY protein [Nanoarchaeota archaeon]